MLNKATNKQIEAAEALIPDIRSRAQEIERSRRLPQDIVQSFVDAELIQMAIADCYGGLESHPLDIMRTIELVSRADASAGWCLMNYQTAALICGSISPQWAKSIFDGAEPCIPSGVLAPTGRGERVDGGIQVSGSWSFGSGCPNANWFFGMTVIQAKESSAATGSPEMVMAIFSKEQFETVDNWHVSGLCGTGSGDVIVQDEFVPEGRWWSPQSPILVDEPLFRIPLSTIFPPCVASVSLGVADAALSEFERMLELSANGAAVNPLRNHPTAHSEFAQAEALIGSARSYVHEATAVMWQTVNEGMTLSHDDRRVARLAGAHAAAACAQAVDILFHSAGSSSILLDQPLQRYWRDANAITKHIQVSHKNFETMGRLRITGELDGQL
ncbi:MAG: acyl-CoA dehydrogenase family protein [Gammaproteobacteria bacterium]